MYLWWNLGRAGRLPAQASGSVGWTTGMLTAGAELASFFLPGADVL